MLWIDGSQGEGGGQIVRSSMALSMITGLPVTIEHVRAKRKKPGLMRQHLTAVRAAAAVCGGTLVGDELKSKKIVFEPGDVVPGEYTFKVGTAGSAPLVLQTVLPALILAGAPSIVACEGGSHNPFAPSVDFLSQIYAPMLSRMGARLTLDVERLGFYPAGGARFVANITPVKTKLETVSFTQRGALLQKRAVALIANLPERVAQRELSEVARCLQWPQSELEIKDVDAAGPGNVFWLTLLYEHFGVMFTAHGAKGKMAEQVAQDAIDAYKQYLATDAVVGPHLADQLVLLMALAGSGSFLTGPPTQHLLTQAQVIEKFLEVDCIIERDETHEGRVWKVEIVS